MMVDKSQSKQNLRKSPRWFDSIESHVELEPQHFPDIRRAECTAVWKLSQTPTESGWHGCPV